MCHNPKCNCRKQISVTPKQFQLEVGSNESKLQKSFKRMQTAWNNFLKPGLRMATSLISADIAAKTKNPQSAQITSNFLKTLTGVKALSLTDMHGIGIRSKVR